MPGSGLTNNNNVQEFLKLRVYNGDIIFWVSLITQPVPISDSIITKDKYIRIYDITIDIVVSDPTLFAQGYRLGKDPVNFAMEMFKTSLRKYASRFEHDKLVPLKRLNDVWNDGLCTDTGLKVKQVSRWSVRDDPKRAEMSSITAQAEIQKLKDRLDRERDREKRDYEREQEMLQHMHDLHTRLRETAAREVTAILQERIRDTFERGASVNEVAEDSLKLLKAFNESLHRGSVVDSTLLSSSETNANDTSAEEVTLVGGDPETDKLIQPSPNLADLSNAAVNETEEN